jgi:hypothetical protein
MSTTATPTETPAPADDKKPEAAAPAPAPEALALDGDIKKLVEKVRKDEKDKQYSTIEKLRGELDAARGALSERDATIKNLAEKKAEGKPPEEKKTDPQPGLSEDKLNLVIAAALKRAEEEIFNPQLSKLQAQNDELKKTLEVKDLDEYRQSLISKNDGQIIPELVTGSTREELDTSLIQAKQIFARTAEALTKKAGGAADAAGRKMVPLPPANGSTPPGATTPGARNMSLVEWSKNREQMLKEASAAAREQIASFQS